MKAMLIMRSRRSESWEKENLKKTLLKINKLCDLLCADKWNELLIEEDAC
jgi:hypothetical protein